MGDDPYLLHRYHRVVALPGFRDLTVGDAAYIHPRLRHSVAGGSNAHEIPIVGTCARPARRDKVPLGDLLFNYHVEVGEGRALRGGKLLVVFRATHLLGHSRIVV